MEDFKEYANKTGSPEKGDLLFASGGEIGLALYKGDDFPVYVQGGSILYVRTSKSEHLKGLFLKYSFESPKIKSYIKSASTGTSLKHFVLKPANSLPVSYPAMKEQEQIGAFFKSIDDTIALHQDKLEKLKQLKKGYLQVMFPQNGETLPRLRFANFFQDWKQRKLGEVAYIIGGGTPSTKNNEFWNGDIDWYSPAEIGVQRYLNGSQKKITNLGLQKSSAKLLPVGTVLFTSRAGIGNTAILEKEGATNQGFQSIVPKKEKLDSYFIYSKTDELKKYGEITGAGSTFIEVSGKQMAKMPLLLPLINEQSKIATLFKELDNTITLQKEKIYALQELKNVYLQKIFV